MATEKNYEIGQRVQKLRKIRGYSVDVLAEKADISRGFLAAVEAGKKGISATNLAGVAIALRVSVDFLIFGSDNDSIMVAEALARLQEKEQEQLCKLFQEAIKILDVLPEEKIN